MFQIRYLSEQPVFQCPGLAIRGLGIREVVPPAYIQRPEGTGDYLFMVFHDPVRLGSSSEARHHPAGTMIYWDRCSPHYYGNPVQPWYHSWIHCDGRDVGRALTLARIKTNRPLLLSDPSRIEKHLIQIHEEFAGWQKPDPVIVRNTLINLIREGAPSRSCRKTPPISEGIAKAREIIDTRYHESLTLAALAASAGLSPSHFCSEFRRHFGIPPIACLIEQRMRVAAVLLHGTTERIGEIGRRVGYQDPYYFSKHFKAVHGVPPSDLRRR